MTKIITTTKLDGTLSITECTNGFWLYDKTRGMNLSMYAKSKDEAFFEALKYYQKRLIVVEAEGKLLKNKVEKFVESFIDTAEDYTLTL